MTREEHHDEEHTMTKETPAHRDVVEATAATEASMPPQKVPVNVYETSGALVIVAPLPAVTAEDVTVQVRPGMVRFFAELRSSGTREYLVREWEYGGYEREVHLPDGYGSAVEASLANGQLAIRVLRGDLDGDLEIKPNADRPNAGS
jgi:HSP20 family molecular chaperone IbpA